MCNDKATTDDTDGTTEKQHSTRTSRKIFLLYPVLSDFRVGLVARFTAKLGGALEAQVVGLDFFIANVALEERGPAVERGGLAIVAGGVEAGVHRLGVAEDGIGLKLFVPLRGIAGRRGGVQRARLSPVAGLVVV